MDLPRPLGPYLLLKQLGEGAMGTIYLARPIGPRAHLPAPVVIKCLRTELAQGTNAELRFEHEAAIAVSVTSPHVVHVYDVGRTTSVLYMAMEHIDGWRLFDVMRAFQQARSQIPIELALALVRDGLRGLHALHTATHPMTHEPLGAVHRDISLRNLMVRPDGSLVLIDLGLGRSNIQEWQTAAGAVLGTPGYMAPEQVTGGRADHRSDLYTLGVILYELLTLQRFIPRIATALMIEKAAAPQAAPLKTIRPEIPDAVDAVVSRAIALRPEDRFESAQAMLEAFDGLDLDLDSLDRNALLPESLFEQLEKRSYEGQELLASGERTRMVPQDTRVIAVRAGSNLLEPDTLDSNPPISETPVSMTPVSKTPISQTPISQTPISRTPHLYAQPSVTQPQMALTPAGAAKTLVIFVRSSRVRRIWPGVGIAVALGIAMGVLAVSRPIDTISVPAAPIYIEHEAQVVPHPEPVQIESRTERTAEVTRPEPTGEVVRPEKTRIRQPREATKEVADERADPTPPKKTIDVRSTKDELRALLVEAGRLRKAHPEHAAQIDEIITDASMWSNADDEVGASSALRVLRKRLNAIRD